MFQISGTATVKRTLIILQQRIVLVHFITMTWAFQIAINILKCHVGMLLLCWPLLFSRIIILDYVPIACPCAIMNNKKWVQMWQVLYWDQNQGHSSAMQQDYLHFHKTSGIVSLCHLYFCIEPLYYEKYSLADFNTLSEKSKVLQFVSNLPTALKIELRSLVKLGAK